MFNQLAVSGILAAALLGVAVPLHAQARTAVSGSELEAAVAARSTQRTENEGTVRQFLQSDRVRDAANGMGVSTEDLSARVGTADDATLNLLAERTRAGERDLAGGDTLVISGTLVIIILLIIILLVK